MTELKRERVMAMTEKERERVRAASVKRERVRESHRAVSLYISIGTPVHLEIDDSWDSWDMS